MRTRAPKKYESLLFFNLGFCSVLLLVGLGACRPQLIRNADQSFTLLNLDSSSGRKIRNDPESPSEKDPRIPADLASVPILDAFAQSDARRFALASITEREAGLGATESEAEQFSIRFGAKRDGSSTLQNYVSSYRFYLRTRDSLEAPNTKSEAMAFAERVHALRDVSDVIRRYQTIFDLAIEKGISKGRAFNLADRFQPLENAEQVAEKFAVIFERAKNGHLDEEVAVRLAEKYSGAENGEALIEQWLLHFNSQQGRMAREQAIIFADQQVAGSIQKPEVSPVAPDTPVQTQETFTAENVPQEYLPESAPANSAELPPVEYAPPQQQELHGATF